MTHSVDDLKKNMAPEISKLEQLIAAGKKELNDRLIAKNTCTQEEFINKWVILFNAQYQEDYKNNKVVPAAFVEAMERYPKRFNPTLPVIIKLPNGQVEFIPPAITPINPKFNPTTIISMINAIDRANGRNDPFGNAAVTHATNAVASELVNKNFSDETDDVVRRKRAILFGRGITKLAADKIAAAHATTRPTYTKSEQDDPDDWGEDDTEII